MPTVLDALRAHLLGNEVADRLEQALASWSALAAAIPANPVPETLDIAWPPDEQTERPIPIFEALRTPSPGYEPLLMVAGWGQLLARGMAKLAVRHGRRRADESRRQRAVFEAIRFLAKPQRRRSAIACRAKLLYRAWNETSLIETIFDEVGITECEFIRLLESLVEGRKVDCNRIAEIAAMISPQLSLRRGPKVRAASAAHEFLLDSEFEFSSRCRPAAYQKRAAEYVDPLTAATRLEFGEPDFDPRPARRRATRTR
jgi:hypothetical protein